MIKELKYYTIEEWLESEYFLKNIHINMYQYSKDAIIRYFNSEKRDLYLLGEDRTGRIYLSYIIVLRLLYELDYLIIKYNYLKDLNYSVVYISPNFKNINNSINNDIKNIMLTSPYYQGFLKGYKNNINLKIISNLEDITGINVYATIMNDEVLKCINSKERNKIFEIFEMCKDIQISKFPNDYRNIFIFSCEDHHVEILKRSKKWV